MKVMVYTQCVRMTVAVPDELEETSEALVEYMEVNNCWPNVIDGDWDDELAEVERLEPEGEARSPA